MANTSEHLPCTSLNLTPSADTSNISLHMDEDASFRTRGQLDFTFSNLNTSDQSILVRLKEAFQLYLRKDEVLFNRDSKK